jgi:hypothetical protein
MLCYDSRNDGAYIAAEYANMLCQLCSLAESCAPALLNTVPELSIWWEQHKREDVERQKCELRARDKQELRRKAIQKLTTAEREALGIRD